MSIDWLLTKTLNNNTKKNTTKGTPKESGLSDKVHGSKSKELNQRKQNFKKKRQPGDEHPLSAKMQNRYSGIELHCNCGYEGKVSCSKMDLRSPQEDKKGTVHFECPNCKLNLQYDCATGKIKIKKGIWGVLLGMFS